MKLALTILALAAVLLPTVGNADDSLPRRQTDTPPKAPQSYNLDLNTGLNPSATPAPPPGTSPLTRESNRPFLGLKLTKPLGN
jgi:hypothetical protein